MLLDDPLDLAVVIQLDLGAIDGHFRLLALQLVLDPRAEQSDHHVERNVHGLLDKKRREVRPLDSTLPDVVVDHAHHQAFTELERVACSDRITLEER